MALPGHRRTSSDKRRRASHFALKKMVLSVCVHCAKPVQPHHACLACGAYGKTSPTSASSTPAPKKKTRSKATAKKVDTEDTSVQISS